ncbi:hypothetical protein B1A99_31325 [Cohnella sp. CIP 111063]|uniref:ATP-binding protein n=1 Tax=unclassified Cohnella TaxID=2636738 RepID=UPI000B8BB92C|nr:MULTISPECIES: ATP-binding protein [unclassified Cohnella]OXS53054.1 hypothetical protein B1A99_31325 [Cohnella sp. CIP 111063]
MLKSNDTLFFSAAFNHAPIGMALVSASGTWLRVNRSLCDILGYPEAELLGRTFSDVTFHEDRGTSWENFNLLIEGTINIVKLEKRYVHKNGQLIWVAVHASKVMSESTGAPYILAQIQDISDRRKTELLLHNSEKLSLVGQMAAGVAHEIRNPLTAVKGFLQLMKSEGVKEQYYDIVFSEFHRIELILTELLVLAKPQEAKMESKDLNQLLSEVVTLMESQSIMSNVRIRFVCALPLIYIDCDENQIKQVVINLVKNAIDAMPDGGEALIDLQLLGDEVQIVVSDQGAGIPDDQLEKIGQPFFTSKENGNGLGMMISFKIIENHGGRIEIESKVGEGTRVKIRLPIGQNQPPTARAGDAAGCGSNA